MSAISDHAIEITTVNGAMTFRSFLSRDDAYSLIKKTLEINTDEVFFVEE